MSSLAFAAKNAGLRVAGYDETLSAVTERLEKAGIPVTDRFSPESYRQVDLIVYTGAIRKGDPVLDYPRSLGIPEMTRAKFLGLLMKSYQNPVGVAGTHGKSTTTGFLASIFLEDEKRDPTVMIGAELPRIASTYRIGNGEDFIFEACEYTNSFLDFFPRLALILNVEHDHADFFPTLEDVIDSFVQYANLAKEGTVVVNWDNPGAKVVASRTSAPVFFFSSEEKKDLWCENLKKEKGFYSFDIMTKVGLYTSVSLKIPGIHNVSNALGAASAAFLSGISGDAVKKGLESFRGVRRRFEWRGVCNGMQVFDDYAHHPDEIRSTLTTAKEMAWGKITVIFQPHTYSRTAAYWDQFVESLSLADRVILADIYSAREEPMENVTAERLANACPKGEYLGDFEHIAAEIRKTKDKGICIVMGAGSIVQLTDKLLDEAL